MGLFDLASPAFHAIDLFLAGFLPAVARVALWGILGAAVGMWIYALLSPQDALKRAKANLATAQAQLAQFDGEFSELWRLVGLTLKLALGRLGLTLGPAIGASIPVIFLLVWISNEYGYEQPKSGDIVDVVVVGQIESDIFLKWQPAEAVQELSDNLHWQARWPDKGATVSVFRDKQLLMTLPTPNLSPIVHQKQWWNSLIANPAGYLPDAAGVEALEIRLTARRIIKSGPDWVAGWPMIFFVSLILGSLVFKIAFRIH